jgi:hypothetical protein
MSGINPVRITETAASAAPPPRLADDVAAAPKSSRTDLALDVTQIALDIVGIFEPTPFADLANTAISLGRGDLLGAGLSVLGVAPYIGDAAKLGKLGKWAKTVSNAVELAKTDAAFAKAVRPALEQLQSAIRSIPEGAMNALPNTAKQQLNRMARQIDEALGTGTRSPAFTPSRTAPTGEIGGTPGGVRATNKPNADPDFKRGIARENQSADILAARGYKVEQGPVLSDADRIRHGIEPGKNPDFLIEGKVFDAYAPTTSTAGGVYSGIEAKVAKGQAHRIVVNLGDTPVTPKQVQDALRENPIQGLQEVIIIDKQGGVHKTFPN